eukprot:3355051-Karenia_brevis.AAC.1
MKRPEVPNVSNVGRFDPYMMPKATKRSASTGDSPKVNGIGGAAANNFGPARTFRGVRHVGKQKPQPLEKFDMTMPPVLQAPPRQ